MMYLKDRGQNAILKAIGFSNRSIYLQYITKTIFSLGAGILPGNILVWSVGDRIAQGTLALIAVHGVNFIRNPIFTYIFVPFATLLATVFATSLGVKGMNKMNIYRYIFVP